MPNLKARHKIWHNFTVPDQIKKRLIAHVKKPMPFSLVTENCILRCDYLQKQKWTYKQYSLSIHDN